MAAALRCALPWRDPQAGIAPDEDAYVLVLGANHRRAYGLRLAWARLRAECQVLDATRVLPTPDTSAPGPRYLNAAVRIAATPGLAPDVLRTRLRAIEDAAGRVRGSGVCALDIDLLARTRGADLVEVYKPDDLRRDYVRSLLAVLQLDAGDSSPDRQESQQADR